MPDHVAFLRAINVGGRRVTKDHLIQHTHDAGFHDVSTFLASGNVLFALGASEVPDATQALEAAYAEGLGYEVEVFVRDRQELQNILECMPFEKEEVAQATSKPQVGFLREEPSPEVAQEIEAQSTSDDLLRVVGRELHWLPLGGVGRSKFDPNKAARLLGPMTLRTQNTVRRLLGKLTA